MDTDALFQDKNTSIHQQDVDFRPPQRPQDVELASGSEAEDDHITLIVQELEPPTHCIQLHDSEHPLHLKMKLASALSKVFGATKAVVDLDKLRHKIKKPYSFITGTMSTCSPSPGPQVLTKTNSKNPEASHKSLKENVTALREGSQTQQIRSIKNYFNQVKLCPSCWHIKTLARRSRLQKYP